MRHSTITDPDADLCGVYAFGNLNIGRLYIGSTERTFRVRWVAHLGELRRGVHHCPDLQADWNAGTPDQFRFAIVEIVSGPTLRQREQFHIAWLGKLGITLYNTMPAWVPPPPPHPSEDALFAAVYDLLPDF